MTITLTISTLAVDTTTIDAADVNTVDNEILTHLNNILNGAQDAEAVRFIEGSAPSTPASGKWKVYFKSAGLYIIDDAGTETLVAPTTSVPPLVCNARLTLTSGTAVTTSDVTAATHVYVTPYRGNQIALYNGTTWVSYSFSEIDINLSLFTADKNYDVFCYDNGSGTVIAETVVWTSDTARATALTLQNGVYVKTGTTTKRYIGTFRTTSTIGQCEDSVTKRYVWNYYNRVNRDFLVLEATDTWTYATATIRPWNNSTSNRVGFVRGVSEDAVQLMFAAMASQAGSVVAHIGMGLDSTTAFTVAAGATSQLGSTTVGSMFATYTGKPSEGFHYLQLLERASGATVTFYGDNGGAVIQSAAIGLLAA